MGGLGGLHRAYPKSGRTHPRRARARTELTTPTAPGAAELGASRVGPSMANSRHNNSGEPATSAGGTNFPPPPTFATQTRARCRGTPFGHPGGFADPHPQQNSTGSGLQGEPMPPSGEDQQISNTHKMRMRCPPLCFLSRRRCLGQAVGAPILVRLMSQAIYFG